MTPEEFRAIRERAGLTQELLAERLGFAPGPSGRVQVARMEAGERPITRRTARLMRDHVTPTAPTREQVEALLVNVGHSPGYQMGFRDAIDAVLALYPVPAEPKP